MGLADKNVSIFMFGLAGSNITNLKRFDKAIRINQPHIILLDMGTNDVCSEESNSSLTNKLLIQIKGWTENYPSVQMVQWVKLTYRHKLDRKWSRKSVKKYNKDVDDFNRMMVDKIRAEKKLGHWKHRGLIEFPQGKRLSGDGLHFDGILGLGKIKRSFQRWC